MTDEDPPLELLGAAYFNQDFRRDASSPDEIVQTFGHDEEWETARAASAEIRAKLDGDPGEDELQQFWRVKCRAYYNPTYDGLTYRDWFERMLTLLAPYIEPPRGSSS